MLWFPAPGLDERVPVVCCPCEPHESEPGYEARCGDRYFSLYCSGVMVIVVDSFLLARLAEPEPGHAAEQQAKWLEDEILRGKLTARHVIVVSHHAWALSQDGFLPGDRVLPLPVAQRFLDKLADSNGQLVLATGADRATFQKRPATNDNNTRIVMVTTPPVLHASSDKLSLRIVRVQTQEVVSDRYTLDELPPVIALDKEERPTPGGENGPDNEDQDKCFSDISSDSDQG